MASTFSFNTINVIAMGMENSVMNNVDDEHHLSTLRALRKSYRLKKSTALDDEALTTGQRVTDRVAAIMGSWTFIIVQSFILLLWVTLNVVAVMKHWDPYPFILLNLALSFQAAYAAPIIMMSQNRQQEIDRKAAKTDYEINVKAELEIELLHQKLDQLREMEILNLTQSVKDLTDILHKANIQVS